MPTAKEMKQIENTAALAVTGSNQQIEEVGELNEFDVKKGALGSYSIIPLMDIANNPNRSDEVFLWNEEKLQGLRETFLVDGFQATFEVSSFKDESGNDTICLAGGGHHRLEALRRIVSDDLGSRVRGLFEKDEEWCIKAVKKTYTPEEMMRNFMVENASAWGKDEQRNVCLMTARIKAHLDGVLLVSDTVDDFVANVKSPYKLKTNESSFKRMKNAGEVGASVIVQYLGPNTWSRPAIQMALNVMNIDGENGAAIREMASKIDSITTVYTFKNVMTDGEGNLADADEVAAAQKLITKNGWGYNAMREADKIRKENPALSGLAVFELMDKEGKKAAEAAKAAAESETTEVDGEAGEATTTETTKAGEAATTTAEAKDRSKIKPAEEALLALKEADSKVAIFSTSGDSWSKAQKKEAFDRLLNIVLSLAHEPVLGPKMKEALIIKMKED